MKKIYVRLSLLLIVGLSACGGSGDDGSSEPPVIEAPAVALLIFPEDNKECTEGIIINEAQSNVTFQWTATENTDSYEIKLTNINTDITTTSTSTTNEKEITLQRGTPYEWFVISKATATNETGTSAGFRFYNQGPGIENYAPFPAEAINPKRGTNLTSNSTVNLQWAGEDIDNDITSYEVLFGTETAPINSLGIVDTNTLVVAITSNTIYYWQIITLDRANNSSRSEIFDFRVN